MTGESVKFIFNLLISTNNGKSNKFPILKIKVESTDASLMYIAYDYDRPNAAGQGRTNCQVWHAGRSMLKSELHYCFVQYEGTKFMKRIATLNATTATPYFESFPNFRSTPVNQLKFWQWKAIMSKTLLYFLCIHRL